MKTEAEKYAIAKAYVDSQIAIIEKYGSEAMFTPRNTYEDTIKRLAKLIRV